MLPSLQNSLQNSLQTSYEPIAPPSAVTQVPAVIFVAGMNCVGSRWPTESGGVTGTVLTSCLMVRLVVAAWAGVARPML